MNLGRRLGRVGVFGQAVVFVLFVRNLSAGLLERELTRLEAALRFPIAKRYLDAPLRLRDFVERGWQMLRRARLEG
jgi:hypothetical protein